MRLSEELILLLGRKGVGVLPAPTNLSPTGFISDTEPNLTWDAVSGATDYTVIVYNDAGTPVFTDTEAASGVTVSPALDPLDGPFTWTVFPNPNGAVASAEFEYTATAYAPFIASIKPDGLIFLGKLNETSGTTAIDISGENNNGTYRVTGMLNQSTFLTTDPVPLWVPASGDYLSMPAGFLSDFNLNESVVLVWVRVRAAGVWTDVTVRYLFEFINDATNRTFIRKTNINNELLFTRIAGGTNRSVTATLSPTGWIQVGLKFSLSTGADGEFKAFINGAQSGSTQTALGTGTGPLTRAIWGAFTTTGTAVWDGYEAYAAVWSGEGNLPTDAEIASIYSFLVP